MPEEDQEQSEVAVVVPALALTKEEAARACRVSPSTIRRAIESQALDPIKVGALDKPLSKRAPLRFDVDELKRWLRSMSISARAEAPSERPRKAKPRRKARA
jgi:hypothetical protein